LCYVSAMHEVPVSIAITNWNGRLYLEDCIQAALDQTYRPDEVILVDNNSDDDGVDFVRERFPEVRIVQLETNDGPSPARNAGLEAARNELVFSIDNDAMLHPECLATLMANLEDDIVIVHPRSVFDGERSRIHYDGASMHYVGMMTLHHFYADLATATTEPSDIDAAISVALLLRRSVVLDCDGYDAAHFILFEDHDLSYRVRSRGFRIRHVPNAIVHHREGTAGISFRKKGSYSGRRVFLHSRNHWIVILKNHGWRAILLGSPGLFLYELSYLFFATKNGCLGAWIRGKFDLVKMLPAIWQKRRKVQNHRRVSDAKLLGCDNLTISPLIERKGLVGRAQVILDKLLRIWWKLVGWMA
jgi:GT2 family glycosyltransferase